VEVTGGCYYFIFENSIVKLSVQCHVFAQSPPGRHRMINIRSKLHITPDLCKNVSLKCYLVATVILIQSVRRQICEFTHKHTHTHARTRTHIIHNMQKLVVQKNRIFGTAVNAACQGNVHACHRLSGPDL